MVASGARGSTWCSPFARAAHGETAFKRFTAAVYYRLLRAMLGGAQIPVDAGDFRLMSRPVVLTLRALREQHRFVRGLVWWVGFRQTSVDYERPARFAGETKYPFRKMFNFAIDGITSFSTVPLRMATWFGVLAGVTAMGGGGLGAVGEAVRDRRRQGLDDDHDPGRPRIVGAAADDRDPGRVRGAHLRRGEAPPALRGRERDQPAGQEAAKRRMTRQCLADGSLVRAEISFGSAGNVE